MAEITRRRQGEMLQAVFTILKDNPEGLPAKEVLHQTEVLLPPTMFENSEYPQHPGFRRYEKIVRFSTIAPVKAGWLVKSKGTWVLTDEGRTALMAFPDPEKLFRESGRLYRIWKKKQPVTEADDEVEDESEQMHPSITLEEAEETARQEIYDYLVVRRGFD